MQHTQPTACFRAAIIMALLAAITLLPAASTWAAGATRTNSVPYAQDFEGWASGSSVIRSTSYGWSGSDTNHATVVQTNYTSSSYPMDDSTDLRVAQLGTDGAYITNNLTGSNNTNNKYWIDMNLQMVQSESMPNITNDTAIQSAIYLNASNQLAVYHAMTDEQGTADTWVSAETNYWTVLDHTPFATDSWHRLTVEMDYDTLSDKSSDLFDYEFFRVLVDGQAISNATMAWDLDNLTGNDTPGGEWFLGANASNNANRVLNATTFSGTGHFDEFVVTNGPVSYNIRYEILASVDPIHAGSVTPGVSNAPAGADVEFTISPSNYWDIMYAVVDGVSNAWSATAYTLSNVTQAADVVFEMNAQRGVSNVPLWWLEAMGVSTNGGLDADSDGLNGWEEWLLQTNPDDSNSWGQVTVTVTNGSNVVSFMADGTIDPDLPPLVLDKGTNLLDGMSQEDTIPRSPSGEKSWIEAATDAFYRIRGTE